MAFYFSDWRSILAKHWDREGPGGSLVLCCSLEVFLTLLALLLVELRDVLVPRGCCHPLGGTRDGGSSSGCRYISTIPFPRGFKSKWWGDGGGGSGFGLGDVAQMGLKGHPAPWGLT